MKYGNPMPLIFIMIGFVVICTLAIIGIILEQLYKWIFQLEVPRIWHHNISMKKVINGEGFKKACAEGKSWTILDCQLSETEDNRWYWEIDKTVFSEDGNTEQLANGEDDDSLEVLGKIWDNFIDKYNPDEYFVDQWEKQT